MSGRPKATTSAPHRTALLAHHRLAICGIAGAVIAFAVPGIDLPLTRMLLGWNVFAWTYLAWAAWRLSRARGSDFKRIALAQADSLPAVIATVVGAAVVSVVAVVFELSMAKAASPQAAGWHAAFALATVAGSWLLLPVLFALGYAALYFARRPNAGLVFPDGDDDFEPDHLDFLYFAFTLAVASQTSDVAISTREMRRLVLAQSIVSYLFNATVVALLINAGAQFV